MSISEERRLILKANNAAQHAETVSCIQKALLSLMEQMPYKDITMTNIIQKSGISRAGVYYNYNNKDEIILDICQAPIDEVLSGLTDSVFDNMALTFRTGIQYADSVKVIIDAGLEHEFLKRMNQRVMDFPNSIYILLWNGMIYNAFMEWFKSGRTDSQEVTIEKLNDALRMVSKSIDTGLRNNLLSKHI